MSISEQSRSNNNGAEEGIVLVIPRLTMPYKGELAEIVADYETDPKRFLVATLHRASQENPILKHLFSLASAETPIPEYAEKWLAIYYSMFSRAAQRAGFPLAHYLNPNLIEATDRLADVRIIELITSLDLSDRLESFNAKITKRRQKDEATNEELGLFWRSIDEDKARLIQKGKRKEDIETSCFPVLLLQEILQKQEDEFRLSEQYK